jgi:hypothetical protein
MNMPTQDEVFLNAVDAIVLDAPARIGDDPRARFAFFKRLLAVAQEVAKERDQRTSGRTEVQPHAVEVRCPHPD